MHSNSSSWQANIIPINVSIIRAQHNRSIGLNGWNSRRGPLHHFVEKSIENASIENDKFELPQRTRATFITAFSPDNSIIASCHGDHNTHILDVKKKTLLKSLSGHERSPWCVTFHPGSNEILATGSLNGEVRVWDLRGDGSESWTLEPVDETEDQVAIASLSFHPYDHVLAIAGGNEILFWDWSFPRPFASVKTSLLEEKVRLVRFDPWGHSIITGVTNAENEDTEEYDHWSWLCEPGSSRSRRSNEMRESSISRNDDSTRSRDLSNNSSNRMLNVRLSFRRDQDSNIESVTVDSLPSNNESNDNVRGSSQGEVDSARRLIGSSRRRYCRSRAYRRARLYLPSDNTNNNESLPSTSSADPLTRRNILSETHQRILHARVSVNEEIQQQYARLQMLRQERRRLELRLRELRDSADEVRNSSTMLESPSQLNESAQADESYTTITNDSTSRTLSILERMNQNYERARTAADNALSVLSSRDGENLSSVNSHRPLTRLSSQNPLLSPNPHQGQSSFADTPDSSRTFSSLSSHRPLARLSSLNSLPLQDQPLTPNDNQNRPMTPAHSSTFSNLPPHDGTVQLPRNLSRMSARERSLIMDREYSQPRIAPYVSFPRLESPPVDSVRQTPIERRQRIVAELQRLRADFIRDVQTPAMSYYGTFTTSNTSATATSQPVNSTTGAQSTIASTHSTMSSVYASMTSASTSDTSNLNLNSSGDAHSSLSTSHLSAQPENRLLSLAMSAEHVERLSANDASNRDELMEIDVPNVQTSVTLEEPQLSGNNDQESLAQEMHRELRERLQWMRSIQRTILENNRERMSQNRSSTTSNQSQLEIDIPNVQTLVTLEEPQLLGNNHVEFEAPNTGYEEISNSEGTNETISPDLPPRVNSSQQNAIPGHSVWDTRAELTSQNQSEPDLFSSDRLGERASPELSQWLNSGRSSDAREETAPEQTSQNQSATASNWGELDWNRNQLGPDMTSEHESLRMRSRTSRQAWGNRLELNESSSDAAHSSGTPIQPTVTSVYSGTDPRISAAESLSAAVDSLIEATDSLSQAADNLLREATTSASNLMEQEDSGSSGTPSPDSGPQYVPQRDSQPQDQSTQPEVVRGSLSSSLAPLVSSEGPARPALSFSNGAYIRISDSDSESSSARAALNANSDIFQTLDGATSTSVGGRQDGASGNTIVASSSNLTSVSHTSDTTTSLGNRPSTSGSSTAPAQSVSPLLSPLLQSLREPTLFGSSDAPDPPELETQVWLPPDASQITVDLNSTDSDDPLTRHERMASPSLGRPRPPGRHHSRRSGPSNPTESRSSHRFLPQVFWYGRRSNGNSSSHRSGRRLSSRAEREASMLRSRRPGGYFRVVNRRHRNRALEDYLRPTLVPGPRQAPRMSDSDSDSEYPIRRRRRRDVSPTRQNTGSPSSNPPDSGNSLRGAGPSMSAPWFGLSRRQRSTMYRHMRRHAMRSSINRIISTVYAENNGHRAVVMNIDSGTYRIQHWDFTKLKLPEISQSNMNVLVPHCKIYNDASVDVSRDGRLLAAFVPTVVGYPDNMMKVQVFSLEPATFGQVLFKKSFGPNAVCLSISPLCNHICVGLKSRQFMLAEPRPSSILMAQILELSGNESSEMRMVQEVHHYVQENQTRPVSINTASWSPEVGGGLVYGTNGGDLILCKMQYRKKT